MSDLSTYFVITKVEIVDQYGIISYTIHYASHSWSRQMRVDMDSIEKFTYEQLRRSVRIEALRLIQKRAPVENNLKRIEKMVGEERTF